MSRCELRSGSSVLTRLSSDSAGPRCRLAASAAQPTLAILIKVGAYTSHQRSSVSDAAYLQICAPDALQWTTLPQVQTRTTQSQSLRSLITSELCLTLHLLALWDTSSSVCTVLMRYSWCFRADLIHARQWISWFLSSKGNEYFCEVEEDYILDRFNLTGLNTEVQHYAQALDLITDNLGTLHHNQ